MELFLTLYRQQAIDCTNSQPGKNIKTELQSLPFHFIFKNVLFFP